MNPKSFLFNFWGSLQLGGFFISFPLPLRYLCATLILLLRIMSAHCRYPPLARFPSFVSCPAWYAGLSFVCCAMRQHRVYVNCPA